MVEESKINENELKTYFCGCQQEKRIVDNKNVGYSSLNALKQHMKAKHNNIWQSGSSHLNNGTKDLWVNEPNGTRHEQYKESLKIN